MLHRGESAKRTCMSMPSSYCGLCKAEIKRFGRVAGSQHCNQKMRAMVINVPVRVSKQVFLKGHYAASSQGTRGDTSAARKRHDRTALNLSKLDIPPSTACHDIATSKNSIPCVSSRTNQQLSRNFHKFGVKDGAH